MSESDGDAPVSAAVSLPAWAVVTARRLAHIERVVALLDRWASRMALPAAEARAWHDAGSWHDALRDAEPARLRALTGDASSADGLLHGPAAADRLAADGESRHEVLDAIRFHTTGHAGWTRTGRALYMADFLEPGRTFMQRERRFLAELVPVAFDQVFTQVVQRRIEWALREDKRLAPDTVALWNSLR
jgi:2-amino-4-hydroxy-6-hydroxymethyldihydropteridine diphosphokinase